MCVIGLNILTISRPKPFPPRQNMNDEYISGLAAEDGEGYAKWPKWRSVIGHGWVAERRSERRPRFDELLSRPQWFFDAMIFQITLF